MQRQSINGGVMQASHPIDAATFTELMKKHAPFGARIALAVSGGPDSMALAILARNWATNNKTVLQGFIVDHGLRAESSAEAAQVKTQLEQLGIAAEILRWEHTPIVGRVHITARKARYHLLSEACRKHDIRDLLLAHHKDDQAETILMRLAKGSGIDGLAGIAGETAIDGVRIVRPLLAATKDQLIATCIAANISFVIDPSNVSDKYARGRLRRVMPLLAEEGLTIERLADLGERASEVRDAVDHYTDIFLREATKRDEAGTIRFQLDAFRKLPIAIAQRALTAALQDIHSDDYAPERASLLPLCKALRADDEMGPRTLHGCLIGRTENHVTVSREFSSITDALLIHPGENVIWDKRWQVTLDVSAPSAFTLRPLGNPPHDVLDAIAPRLRKQVPQGRSRACLPSLFDGETFVGLPSWDTKNLATMRLLKAWPPIQNF